jgi:phage terminase large subunit-like protein
VPQGDAVAGVAGFVPHQASRRLDSDPQTLFDTRAWERCTDSRLALHLLEGQPRTITTDLASKTDIAAVILLFERKEF